MKDTATQVFTLQAQLQVFHASATNIGGKARNDDHVLVYVPADPVLLGTKGIVAVIADGVSSAEGGQQASQLSVQRFVEEFYQTPDTWTTRQSCESTLAELNQQLFHRGGEMRDAERGYVTTLSLVVLKSRFAHVLHVGDTRVYRLSGDTIERVTRDHKTRVSAEEVYLARAMGLDSTVQVDYHKTRVEVGDIFVLTSDGLHDVMEDQAIQRVVLGAGGDDQAACETLVRRARAAGSEDNITCQIVRVTNLPAEDADSLNRRLTRLPFPKPMSVGDELDGFRVEQELHASARSQVYLVRDIDSNEQLVMKTPSVNFEDDIRYIERFVMEEWIGRRVQTPHVLRVVRQPRPATRLYYLSEPLCGGSLRDWMTVNPQPEYQQVVPLAQQIVHGLRAFQRRSILHQDLKPGNILLDERGQPVIVDFGSCYVRAFEDLSVPIERDLILGTADYAAPEYHLGAKADIRADLFSLGVIVYEMLTGALPYGDAYGKARTEAEFAALSYVPAYRHNAKVPVWIDGALAKAVCIRPEDRYKALSAFMFDLHNPNREFLRQYRKPLIERDPVLFWKGLAAILFVLLLLALLVR